MMSFRAWDNEQGFWHDTSPCMIMSPVGDEVTVEIGTQMPDAFGQEIFEGDLVRLTTPNGMIKSVVVFERGVMAVRLPKENAFVNLPLSLFAGNNCQVLGNIHDNADMV